MLHFKVKRPFMETVRQKKAAIYNVKAACTDFLGSLGLVPNTTEYSE